MENKKRIETGKTMTDKFNEIRHRHDSEEPLKTIGVYGLTNTAAVCVHEIDYSGNRVLASINGRYPEWCDLLESTNGFGELRYGFKIGELYVSFDDVMLVDNGTPIES